MIRKLNSKKLKKTSGKIFIISGPSGSGKTTLLGSILKDRLLKGKITKSISFTTRPKRSGEIDKKDYFFIKEGDFLRLLRAKKFLEWTKYLGYYYATPKDFVEQQIEEGKNIALCLDLRGLKQIRKIYPKQTIGIFIHPPSFRELRNRIEGRCSKTQTQEINNRLKLAREEVILASKYNYSLVNKDLKEALVRLRHILLGQMN